MHRDPPHSAPPTRRELARALDIVPDDVRRLAKRGMPTTSIEAARAWRAVHVPHSALKTRAR